MKISEICITRPVFATVLSLLILLTGIVSFSRIDIKQFPTIDYPVITVNANYVGANSEVVESKITNILEESLAAIEGIDSLQSISKQGASQITATFTLDTDTEKAANDVRDAVAKVRNQLPRDLDQPTISKVSTDAEPVMYLSFYSDTQSPLYISDYADRNVKDKLQTIKGVASVALLAERRMSMRIFPNKEKMRAYNISYNDINNAIAAENAELPAGNIEGINRWFTVLTKAGLSSVHDFENIVVKAAHKRLVRLKDIATAELAPEEDNQIARFKSKNTVALGIIKQSKANSLDIAEAIHKELVEIRKTLPENIKIEVAFDKSVFIKESIKAVYHTIFEAVILVVIIIFLFLASFRSTIIPLVTIPVSIIGSFAFMLYFGFSINTLTLLALVLAIGLVVDDAIVVMENIYRHIEEGLPPMQAALVGAEEIGFAIIATTFTLAAVFLPVGFAGGIAGKLFTEFAWTLAIAVVISGFVALTLSPMMCSRLLKKEHLNYPWLEKIQNYLDMLIEKYQNSLEQVLEHKKNILLATAGLLILGGITFKMLPAELAPSEDQGYLITIIRGPEGSSLEYVEKNVSKMEEIFASHPNIEAYFTLAGYPSTSEGIAFLLLKPWNKRSKSSGQIAQELMPPLMAISGIFAFPIVPPALLSGAMSSKPLEFVIKSNLTYEQIQSKFVEPIVAKMRENTAFKDIETDLYLNQPRLEILLNRDKINMLGVTVSDVAQALATLVGSSKVNSFNLDNKQYYVILQLKRGDRILPQDLKDIYVKSFTTNKMIPLGTFIDLNETIAAKELNHLNRMRAVKISANLDGIALDKAVNIIEQINAELLTSGSAQYEYSGQTKEFKKSSSTLYYIFLLALLFIYLVLAAQFESFKDPLIILVAVPLAMAGALIGLYFSGSSLNIYSQIGLITLIGLIAKNSILIVEFTNQLIASGKELRSAIIQASVMRLRPILMTSCATILGALPLALASGPGSGSRHSIGWVIVAGLFIGTIFTMYIIPIVCEIFKKQSPRSEES